MELSTQIYGRSGETQELDPEVSDKPTRRRFTAKYKLGMLRQADACTKHGELGALLRREGLYSSHLANWRNDRKLGELAGLSAKKRGPKASADASQKTLIAKQERVINRLRKQLDHAEMIIDIQKKVATLLGIPLQSPDDDEND